MKVKDVMTRNVEIARHNNSIKDVARQMKNLNIGSLPVCDNNNRPIGIVTDRDIVIRNVSEGSDSNDTIDRVMTNKVVSVGPETDIHEAARIMSANQVRRLPVIENEKLVGIVALGDLAVRDIYVNEAGDALSNISEPSRPLT